MACLQDIVHRGLNHTKNFVLFAAGLEDFSDGFPRNRIKFFVANGRVPAERAPLLTRAVIAEERAQLVLAILGLLAGNLPNFGRFALSQLLPTDLLTSEFATGAAAATGAALGLTLIRAARQRIPHTSIDEIKTLSRH